MTAPAGRIWDLVSDVTRIGEFSPETFELTPLPLLRLYWALLGWTRGRTNINGMRTTLERVKAAAEADPD
jgi:hypothetical protein